MRVALVTTWGIACGIAEHSALLVEALQQADPSIAVEIVSDLHPQAILGRREAPAQTAVDLVVLNYQAALHSQWTPGAITAVKQTLGVPVVVVYHDTGVPNSEQCQGIAAAADAMIIHEPAEDLPGRVEYWRMGVPPWPAGDYAWGRETWWKAYPDQPVLGSVGFPFPWKNYTELARIAGEVGWACHLLAPQATTAQITEWQALNPHTRVESAFLPRAEVIRKLAACDATAFLYTCANTGQSGAVLQGIAARKPVFAFESCRQFRALYADPLANKYVRWCTSFAQFQERLANTILGRVDCGMVALAEQESWARLGRKYAALFHALAADPADLIV